MPVELTRPHGKDKTRPRLEDRFADEARFIRTWLENPSLTGAVSPSGRFLARMMARAVDPFGSGPIVELGPGTGPITQALLKRGVDPSRLVLVEFDGAFCRLLKKRFPGAHIVQTDAYDLPGGLGSVLREPAASIVSSLPLLNKPDAKRLELLDDAFSLMDPNGSFVQFTYGMNSPIPRAAALKYDADVSPPVWFNLPPARVWIYRRKGQAAARAFDLVPRDAQRLGSRFGDRNIFRPALFKPASDRHEGMFLRKRDTAFRNVRD